MSTTSMSCHICVDRAVSSGWLDNAKSVRRRVFSGPTTLYSAATYNNRLMNESSIVQLLVARLPSSL